MSDKSDIRKATKSDKVVSLNPQGWHSRTDIAAILGVSTRTVERRVKAGLVEKRHGVTGMLYRTMSPVGQKATRDVAVSPKRQQSDTERHEATSVLVARLEEQAVEIAELQRLVSSYQTLVEAQDQTLALYRRLTSPKTR